MKTNILLAISLALTMPSYAEVKAVGGAAQEKTKAEPENAFTKKDKDKDGFLSKEEFIAGAKDAAKAEAAFTKKDKDADNKLSPAEFAGKGGKGGKEGAKKGSKKADKEEVKKPE